MPDPPKSAAVPVAAGEPEQSADVYSFTVEPASAVPLTEGEVLAPGEAGATAVTVGATGAAESLV